MNPMPVFSKQDSTSMASPLILTPIASNMSAPPHLLLIARFPCFAMGTPHDAAIIAAMVLTLNVLKLSPPVPQVSTRDLFKRGLTLIETWRMAFTKPVISDMDSPLVARAAKKADMCIWLALPLTISIIQWYASLSFKSSPETTFFIPSSIILITNSG